MSKNIKIATFWKSKLCITIFEDLYADLGGNEERMLGISPSSGFSILVYSKDEKQIYKCSLGESSVLNLKNLYPFLLNQLLTVKAPRIIDGTEAKKFQTQIPFSSITGMTVADMLACEFTEKEFGELKAILERNCEKYEINKILLLGINDAIEMIRSGDCLSINNIVTTYAERTKLICDSSWRDVSVTGENGIIMKSRICIYACDNAKEPFVMRFYFRHGTKDKDNPLYPYSGLNVRSLRMNLTQDEFYGNILNPMITSSEAFRRTIFTGDIFLPREKDDHKIYSS